MDEVYFLLRQRGPFYGTVDPWAESGRYFQQIHAEMISHLLAQIQPPLEKLGYVASREASLQIAESAEPDIFIQRTMDKGQPGSRLDYELAAAEVLAEPGVIIEDRPATHAIHIREQQRLITIIEIISPNNKTRAEGIADYRARRERLLLDQGVNIVEIDPTRSIKRLLKAPLAAQHAYHVAVFLPGESPRFIRIAFLEALKRIAVPLKAEVIPIDLQPAYDEGYQRVRAAVQMLNEGRYTRDWLPFPSTLTDAQIEQALAAVAAWQAELARP